MDVLLQFFKLARRDEVEADFQLSEQAQAGNHLVGGDGGAGDVQGAVLDAERHDAPGAGRFLRDGAAGARADLVDGKMGPRQALLETERLHELFFRNQAFSKQEVGDGGGGGTPLERLLIELNRTETEELADFGQRALVRQQAAAGGGGGGRPWAGKA